MTKDELEKEKNQRFAFANAVYDGTAANEMNAVDMWEIGKSLGLNHEALHRICQYLKGEGLIRSVAIGGAIGITHKGIVEIESAVERPNVPTEHFPAINYIQINEMYNSQIQQGTSGSTQTQTLSAEQMEAVKTFVKKFREEIPNLNLSSSATQEAMAELATLEAQTNSSKPKLSIIKESLLVLKELAMHTVGAMAAHELIAHIPNLF